MHTICLMLEMGGGCAWFSGECARKRNYQHMRYFRQQLRSSIVPTSRKTWEKWRNWREYEVCGKWEMRLDWVMQYYSILGKFEQGAEHVFFFVHYKTRCSSLVESLAITHQYKYTNMYIYKHVYTHTHNRTNIYTHTHIIYPSIIKLWQSPCPLDYKANSLSLPSLSSQVPPLMLVNRCIFDGQKCTQETYKGDQNTSWQNRVVLGWPWMGKGTHCGLPTEGFVSYYTTKISVLMGDPLDLLDIDPVLHLCESVSVRECASEWDSEWVGVDTHIHRFQSSWDDSVLHLHVCACSCMEILACV